MGDILSTSKNSSVENPSESPSPSPSHMSASRLEKLDPQSQDPDPKTLELQSQEASYPSDDGNEKVLIDGENKDREGGEEEEEEGECGFCLFMKGGGCRESFTAWEKCVEEADRNEEDLVEKCFEVTANLKKCMEAHSDYYEPILKAEKMAEEEAIKELEDEAEKKDGKNAGPKEGNGSGSSEKQLNPAD
ncbi:hypothetical protein Nepgr_029441 [Nepenthes gracilis]|uniref:GCK domain-containing protein n=1 Tax=Nepenthes gracilis TaxID=150966 RepID=A0AAD3Y397_NEPGR|nr:hypothetical protein Nepgr_029441 [Nepenthes gracilis]